MPKINQNFTVFEDDTSPLLFEFSDLQENFTSDWGVWFGTFESNQWPPSPTPPGIFNTEIEKHTAWTNTGNGALTQTNGSDGNPDIEIVADDNIIKVYFTQQDFFATSGVASNSLVTNKNYYYELVTSPDKDEDTSLVAASGFLYISASIFSVANYRPS
tara:strand:+ start:1545 stop:2021 length:477 start_codon:yes stop_codon:yes gene_type:complete